MITPESHPQRLRVAHLNPNTPTTFHLRPDEGVREALAAELGLDALTRLQAADLTTTPALAGESVTFTMYRDGAALPS